MLLCAPYWQATHDWSHILSYQHLLDGKQDKQKTIFWSCILGHIFHCSFISILVSICEKYLAL